MVSPTVTDSDVLLSSLSLHSVVEVGHKGGLLPERSNSTDNTYYMRIYILLRVRFVYHDREAGLQRGEMESNQSRLLIVVGRVTKCRH